MRAHPSSARQRSWRAKHPQALRSRAGGPQRAVPPKDSQVLTGRALYARPGAKRELYIGDNLDILRRYIAPESVDLVYLDPPFKSNQNYYMLFGRRVGARAAAQQKAFEDTWEWNAEPEHACQVMRQKPRKLGDATTTLYRLLGPVPICCGAAEGAAPMRIDSSGPPHSRRRRLTQTSCDCGHWATPMSSSWPSSRPRACRLCTGSREACPSRRSNCSGISPVYTSSRRKPPRPSDDVNTSWRCLRTWEPRERKAWWPPIRWDTGCPEEERSLWTRLALRTGAGDPGSPSSEVWQTTGFPRPCGGRDSARVRMFARDREQSDQGRLP